MKIKKIDAKETVVFEKLSIGQPFIFERGHGNLYIKTSSETALNFLNNSAELPCIVRPKGSECVLIEIEEITYKTKG